uniref:RING-type domain-containing protein n=1 Tax=Varanus komodoensis TaxID=61221 RepID=A0A8D2KZ84_VARKO
SLTHRVAAKITQRGDLPCGPLPCLHSFCFSCSQSLLETKAECPCCNQPFSSIFHPVKLKGCPKEFLFPKLSKEEHSSSSPTKKHPKEEYIPSSAKKHTEKRKLAKSHSEDDITVSSKDYSLSRPNSKKPYKTFSQKGPKDRPLCSGFAKRQAFHECNHLSVLGKRPNSGQVSLESVQDTNTFEFTPEQAKYLFVRLWVKGESSLP